MATSVLPENDIQPAGSPENHRTSRRSRVVVAVLVSLALATLVVAGVLAYRAHERAVAEHEAMLDRVATAVQVEAADQEFYRQAGAGARAQQDAEAVAAYQQRVDAAIDEVELALESAGEALGAAEGKVLDDDADAVSDLEDAIEKVSGIGEQFGQPGSVLSVRDLAESPGLLDEPIAGLEQAVEAWQEEQDRLEAERRERERQEAERREQERIEAERRRAEEARQQQQQQQSPTRQQSSSSNSTSSPSNNTSSSSSSSSGGDSSPAPQPSSSGRGKSAAESAASQYGLTVNWVTTTGCGTTGAINGQAMTITGCYTSQSANQIELSVGNNSPNSIPSHDAAVGAARSMALHESAHAMIYRKCGTTGPAVAAGRVEQVTDAYANLFMGAPAASGGYGHNDSDAQAARAINAGDCG